MSKKRVHELAKELGIDNREALLALQNAGMPVKTHSSSVYEAEALVVLNKLKGPKTAVETPSRRMGMMIVKKRRNIEVVEETTALEPASVRLVDDTTAQLRHKPATSPVSAESAATVHLQLAPEPQATPEPSSPSVTLVHEVPPAPEQQHPLTPAPSAATSASSSSTDASTSDSANMSLQLPSLSTDSERKVNEVKSSHAAPERSRGSGHRPASAPSDARQSSAQKPRYPQNRPSSGRFVAPASQSRGNERATATVTSSSTSPPAAAHFTDGAMTPAATPSNRNTATSPAAAAPTVGSTATAKPPGTGARVVRMIDRSKLMERIPTRRLGSFGQSSGGQGGAGQARDQRQGGALRPHQPGSRPFVARSPNAGPRFGPVTEIKVVVDPFGRGREMVALGRDKKAKVATGGSSGGYTGHANKPNQQNSRRQRSSKGRDSMDMRERATHPSRLKKKKTGLLAQDKSPVSQPKAQKRVIKMKTTMVISEFAKELGVKATDVVRKLMGLGLMLSQNQSIDFDTAQLIAADFEYTVESIAFNEEAHIKGSDLSEEENAASLVPRAPIVTIMGHVDHGKTSLLDAIRSTKVVSGEAGGITQHIGAYMVEVGRQGKKQGITFLDTPGHAAFTAMRARGAQLTDIVVLVVAADDGVMPQTEEAILHAQAAKVPIVVAVNKIDKPSAQPDRVMQELTKFNLLSEEWGGETLYVNTSATSGEGIDKLLDTILLQAEVLELKANPDRPATGMVIEAKLDKGKGPVATVLVQQGTLRTGDVLVVGNAAYGKLRAMTNDMGRKIDTATPAMPVEVTGLDNVPQAGDSVKVVSSLEDARKIITHRSSDVGLDHVKSEASVSLDDLMKRIAGKNDLELKIVLKADVQGSLEALKNALANLSSSEVSLQVIYGGVGAIKESDIMLAAASNALVVGFAVVPDPKARQVAEREGVEVRTFHIIYEVLEAMTRAMEGLLGTESREKIVGRAEVRDLFKVSKVGTVAGCRVVEGKATRSARIRVLRDNVHIYDGKVLSLRHFKNDVREVESGLECGVGIENFNDVKLQDVLEFYTVEEIARSLPRTTSIKTGVAMSQQAPA